MAIENQKFWAKKHVKTFLLIVVHTTRVPVEFCFTFCCSLYAPLNRENRGKSGKARNTLIKTIPEFTFPEFQWIQKSLRIKSI